MPNTLDMHSLIYLNLFEKITSISTRFCFKYNEHLVFCVPKQLVIKAIGKDGRNAKKISEILRKKIKIIPLPRGIEDAESFIKNIINPFNFKEFKIQDDEILITAGNRSKAALIGRDKRRLIEMQKIVKDFFQKNLKII